MSAPGAPPAQGEAVHRRSVLRAATWGVPVIAVAANAPSAAASTTIDAEFVVNQNYHYGVDLSPSSLTLGRRRSPGNAYNQSPILEIRDTTAQSANGAQTGALRCEVNLHGAWIPDSAEIRDGYYLDQGPGNQPIYVPGDPFVPGQTYPTQNVLWTCVSVSTRTENDLTTAPGPGEATVSATFIASSITVSPGLRISPPSVTVRGQTANASGRGAMIIVSAQNIATPVLLSLVYGQ